MALVASTLKKPVNKQIVDPSTGLVRDEWELYFQSLTKLLNAAAGELAADPESAVLNVKDFGAVGTGLVDDAPAFQAAFDYAATLTYPLPVFAPPGLYLINTTVTCSKEGQEFFGSGMRTTVLRPGMTDGTACVRFTGGPDFWHVHDLGIATSMNSGDFSAGIVDGQNCIGFEAYATGSPFIARFSMENVYIYGCAAGYKIGGFIATLTNLYAHFCDVGFIGYLLNSTWANLRLEGNRKSIEITDSNGLELAQYLDEGAVSGAVAGTIDACRSVTITTPYWEGHSSYPRTEPFVVFGGTTEVQALSIIGAHIVGSGGMAPDTYPIKLDRVDGCNFSANIADGTGKHGVETTANTKNLTEFALWREHGAQQDASKAVSAPVNWFANPLFDAWFRGWDDVGLNRATATQETTIVRRGANAIRIDATAGQNFNNITWQQSKIATALRGKTIRVGAWIWVPAITEYDENNLTAFPAVAVQSYNGSVFVSNTAVNAKMVNGAWNFLHTSVEVQSDAIRIYISVFANQAAAAASGNEYVIVDSITLCEDAVPVETQQYGRMVDSVYLPQFATGKMVAFESAVPGDPAQTYEVGDLIFDSAPVANSSLGWICTTGGVGGVAVFSTLPDLHGPPTATDSAVALWAGTTGKVLKNSVVTINSTGIIIGGRFLNNGLQLLDTDASHVLTIIPGSNLTSNRSLTITTGDASRTLTLGGNVNIDQDISTAGSPSYVGPRATGTLGFATGAGGTVTQATDKTTGVTLNKACGQITMNNAALAAGASVNFTLTNSTIAALDVPLPVIGSGGTANAYTVDCTAVGAGSCSFRVTNVTGGSLSEAPVINFAVLKGVIT